MLSETSQSVVQRSKALYESRHRAEYEKLYMNKYLSIEPESGQLFLGDSMDDAINAAMEAFPDRLTFTLQIGNSAALHLGVLVL